MKKPAMLLSNAKLVLFSLLLWTGSPIHGTVQAESPECDVPPFQLTIDQRNYYRTHGYVVLRGLVDQSIVEYFDAEIEAGYEPIPEDSFWHGDVDRQTFELVNEQSRFQEWISSKSIRSTLTSLMGAPLAVLNTIGVQVRGDQPGYDYHIGTVTFAPQYKEDAGATLWIPTRDVDPDDGGGISFISTTSIDAQPLFFLDAYYSDEFFEGMIKSGLFNHYFSRKLGLDDGVYKLDTIRKGDAVLFDKRVVHKTNALHDESDKRNAMVVRLVDLESRFTKKNKLVNYGDAHYDNVNMDAGEGSSLAEALKTKVFIH